METGRSSSVYSAYSSVRSMPRTSPSDDTISDTTSPQPPCRFTSLRKAVSVIPAIGATTYGEGRTTAPIFMCGVSRESMVMAGLAPSVGAHIGGVDLDADSLADQIDRQHEKRFVRL